MRDANPVQAVVEHYLDAVRVHLAHLPSQRREATLSEIREHIADAMRARASGDSVTVQDAYAALAEMDPPEAYADGGARLAEPPLSRKFIALGLLCSALQIAGLWAVIAAVPVLGAVSGFAAIVIFFLIWSNRASPSWLVGITGAAAAAGLGMIAMELSHAL
ncbi:MAG: hypothetical protein AAF288_14155 [Planctomycetota bacterium]